MMKVIIALALFFGLNAGSSAMAQGNAVNSIDRLEKSDESKRPIEPEAADPQGENVSSGTVSVENVASSSMTDGAGPGAVSRGGSPRGDTTRALPVSNPAYNCPFRPDDSRVTEIWATAKATLQGQQSTNQICRSALEPLQQSVASSDLTSGLMADPDEIIINRITQIRNQILVLSADPETNRFEIANLQEEEARLTRQLEDSRTRRRAVVYNSAVDNTLGRLNTIIEGIKNVQTSCQGTDINVAQAAARSGLQLFSAASPLIFGTGTPIGVIANLVSGLADALTGPTRSERGLRYLSNVEDFQNLSCFYFHVQKKYCELRDPQSTDYDANVERLEHVRTQFERERSALGTRMRNLFNEIYSRPDLGPTMEMGIPQICGLMSSIPGNSPRCTQADRARLGPNFSSCNYINYLTQGTAGGTRRFPTDAPAAPLSTGAPGSR